MATKVNGNKKYFKNKETADKIARQRGEKVTKMVWGEYYVGDEKVAKRKNIEFVDSAESKGEGRKAVKAGTGGERRANHSDAGTYKFKLGSKTKTYSDTKSKAKKRK